MGKVADFEGWITKNNVRCSDGAIIRENAFAHWLYAQGHFG